MSGKSFVSILIAVLFIFTGATGCAVSDPSITGTPNSITAIWTEDDRVVVTLDRVEGATGYVLYTSERNNLSPALNVSDDDVYDHWFPAPELGEGEKVTLRSDKFPSGNGIHYVIVTSIDGSDQESSPTEVNTVIPSVSITSATYDEATNEITVSWNGVSGAASYQLYGGPDNTLSRTNYLILHRTPSTTFKLIAPADEFFFAVTALDGDGVEGAFGKAYSFSKVATESGCSEGHKWYDGSDPFWTYSDCNPSPNKFVTQATIGENGIALGSQMVTKGRITFSSTGMSNDQIHHEGVFSLFIHAQGHQNLEVNWHWVSWPSGGGLTSRLTTQRFDGTCRPFCEKNWQTTALSYISTAEVFDWDCSWDTGGAACEVTKNGNTVLASPVVTTEGPYFQLNYIGVGTGAFRGPYATAPFTISNLRASFFK